MLVGRLNHAAANRQLLILIRKNLKKFIVIVEVVPNISKLCSTLQIIKVRILIGKNQGFDYPIYII